MKRVSSTLVGLLIGVGAFSQGQEIQATTGLGDAQFSVSLSYGWDWELWKSKKFAIGLGGRLTSYFASNQYYITAPAKLTSGSTGPLVIFKENIEENIDTFLVQSPQMNAINAFVHLRYKLHKKIHVGFNIDMVGFSFGKSTRGTFISNDAQQVEEAVPTLFNILLISDNDRGSLNSELYGKYYWNDNLAVKVGAQFLFTEYTTTTDVQQYPEPNDRFRNKSLMLAFGIAYKL